MFQRSGVCVISILLIFAFCMLNTSSISAKTITLKLATMAPEGSIWMQEIDTLNADLEKATGGKVKFKVYPGGIMGGDDVVFRKIRVGQLDGALVTTNGLSKLNEDFYLLTWPGLFKSYDEVDYFLREQSGFFNEHLQDKDFEALGVMSLGFTYTYTSLSIQNFDDMKQAKAWLWDNDPVMTTMYSQLGVTPVSVGIGDVMTALQTGLLNTVFNTPTGIVSLQWFTRINQMIDLPLTHSFGAFVLKTKSWNKIPQELQPIVRELVQSHAREITQKTRIEDDKARTVISSKGVSITEPSKALSDSLSNVFDKAIADLLRNSDNPGLYHSLNKELTSYRNDSRPE